MNNDDYRDLILKSKNGDQNAFEKIIVDLKDHIKYQIYRYRFSFNFEFTKDDVIQVAYIAVWEAISKCKNAPELDYPKAYLTTAINNQICTKFTKVNRKKVKVHELNARLDASVNVNASENCTLSEIIESKNKSIEDLILEKEAYEYVLGLSVNLNEREKETFNLWAKGYNPTKICEILGVPIRTVENALYTGKRKIRKHANKIA
ncbi:RNA polymerase sigma factor [Metaclostridioides mangenotii]|uniref:RNA polymerase sigma factor n=1 Tax=Metaclostridioides mangenotii TaxID=1540 RepID=UPI000481DA8B|nr:RNA polymerase sigma factor [Clostridioides mangenotii]